MTVPGGLKFIVHEGTAAAFDCRFAKYNLCPQSDRKSQGLR